MHNYRKILASVLATCLLMSLSGCGNSSENSKLSTSASKKSAGNATSTSQSSVLATSENKTASNIKGSLIKADLTVDCKKVTPISEKLFGIFLEDINHAVDGGLYAEMIKNRSFDFKASASGAAKHGWFADDGLDFSVKDGSKDNSGLNKNNESYAVLVNPSSKELGIANRGFLDGMKITKGTYTASVYLKGLDGFTGPVKLSLGSKDKPDLLASKTIDKITDSWKKYTVTFDVTDKLDDEARLKLSFNKGSIAADMISLMPDDTYKGLPVRKDIGEALEALHPSFMRFPGGCVIEGRNEDTMYRWKDSIGMRGLDPYKDKLPYFNINGKKTLGDVAARPMGESIWRGSSNNPTYTTYGLGFYEYFNLCEALRCIPLPVLNAGMTCQPQSGNNYKVYPVNSKEFKECVQDAIDLVEFANGDAKTTKWGAIRAAMGHETPYGLKYIAIGNEQWQQEYHDHYNLFVEAFDKAKAEKPDLYGDIVLCVANGTGSGDKFGYNYLEDYPDDMTGLVDEHFYESPDWFLSNTKRYDTYDRGMQAKVFLGEYAAKSNSLEAALAEASFMTGLERNGDIVQFACYAPLFGNARDNQWNPDLIYYNKDMAMKTADYHVQQLFSVNSGSEYEKTDLTFSGIDENAYALSGKVGLGTWMTNAEFDNLKVTDNESGKVLYENNFDKDGDLPDDFDCNAGNWKVENGKLVQTNTGNPSDQNTGDSVYTGNVSWQNYTLEVDATKKGGNEGFLIPVAVTNSNNNIFWNLGGWGNTVSCLQEVANGVKSGQVQGTVKNCRLKSNTDYHLKVVVNKDNIKCYLDDELYIDYTKEPKSPCYASSVRDEKGDLIIKLVNTTEGNIDTNINITNADMEQFSDKASVTVLAGANLKMENSYNVPDAISPKKGDDINISDKMFYDAPAYSLTVIRISKK